MSKIKRLFALLICACMLLMATACGSDDTGSTNSNSTDSAASETPAEASDTDTDEVLTIGIIQYMEHTSLDQAREGFIQALADNGFVEGDNVEFDYQNAQSDSSNLSTISQRFVNNNSDLILAIATPAAQSVLSETDSIPVVGTAITDYEEANLVDSDENPGGNMTGTNDMNPIKDQLELLIELCPDVKTVGIVYSSNEDNSILQAQLAVQACEELGLETQEATVTTTNDVQQVTNSIASKVDALYIPTDNVYAASMPVVESVCTEYKIPCITGAAEMVTDGGFATLGISYFNLGYQTGEMAVKILNGEAEPATMPIESSNEFEYIINGYMAEVLGIEIPEKYAEYVVNSDDTAASDADTESSDNAEGTGEEAVG